MARKVKTSKISSILRPECSRTTMKGPSNLELSLRLEVTIETIKVMIPLMLAKCLKVTVAMREITKTL